VALEEQGAGREKEAGDKMGTPVEKTVLFPLDEDSCWYDDLSLVAVRAACYCSLLASHSATVGIVPFPALRV